MKLGLTDLETKVDNLETKVDNLETNVSNLQKDVTALQRDTARLKEDTRHIIKKQDFMFDEMERIHEILLDQIKKINTNKHIANIIGCKPIEYTFKIGE